MKITLEHILGQELEVVLRGDTESKEARQVLATLNHASSFGKLMLQDEDESFLVDPGDIRYFEASGGRTYAVTKDGRFEIREKLYELAAALNSKGFIQINKSTVVNINFVRSIAAEFSGNYSARMKDSDETLTISRKYFQTFKEFVRR